MTVSLTDIEVQRVLDACIGYMEIMGGGEDTHDYTEYEIETGLGSALRKISKGRNGEAVYGKYKTVIKYPTFEEWKAARAESEEQYMEDDCTYRETGCGSCKRQLDCPVK